MTIRGLLLIIAFSLLSSICIGEAKAACQTCDADPEAVEIVFSAAQRSAPYADQVTLGWAVDIAEKVGEIKKPMTDKELREFLAVKAVQSAKVGGLDSRQLATLNDILRSAYGFAY